MKNDELLHKWVNGQLSKEEEISFKNRPEFQSLEALQQQMDRLKSPSFQGDPILASILSGKKKPGNPGRLEIIRLLPYAAAAVALLLMVWFFAIRNPAPLIYATTTGQQLEQLLPDQSTVIINSESTLSLQAAAWPENRTLNLTGEAFFNVQEGSTFTVETERGTVRVLGTSFNVWSRDETLEVSCYSGQVMVSFDGINPFSVTLAAGQAIRLNDEQALADRRIETAQNQRSWTSGVTSLHAVTLARCIAELQHQFGITIKPNNVDTKVVLTANFQHSDLELALQTVFRPLNIRYDVVSDTQVNLFQEKTPDE